MSIQSFPLLAFLAFLSVVSLLAIAKAPICSLTSLSRACFPEGFLFGSGSSAYQYEGAVNASCRGPSIWDIFMRRYPDRNENQTGDVAIEFYYRYKEDIKLLKDTNMDAFRFSISWPRIFPHGRMDKGVSKDGVQFYNDLIDELIANGIAPLATIFHWDLPQDLEDEYGGFRSERIVKDYVEFANFSFHTFGDRVKHWVTFNEPFIFSRFGYDMGLTAPGRCSKYMNPACEEGKSGYELYIVSHNLLLAHAEAVEEFRKCEKCKPGKIGIAHCPFWFEPYDPDSGDSKKAAGRALQFMFDWHMDPIKFGDYPQIMKDLVGDRLPSFTPLQKVKLRDSYDFVGINYYSAYYAAYNESVDPQKPNWMSDSLATQKVTDINGERLGEQPSNAQFPIYPEGLRKILNYVKDKYQNPEIIITENGYGETEESIHYSYNALEDHYRQKYFKKHLEQLHLAIREDNVNVTAYFVWSFLDNLEWQRGYSARYGLYYTDYKNNLTRIPKNSSKWFKHFLRKNVGVSPISDEL